ncbi:MAG: DUF2950 family protein [Rhizobiaceae bacterium]|nr:DUF2950 family protein [Rhizobiaceae bacterium]
MIKQLLVAMAVSAAVVAPSYAANPVIERFMGGKAEVFANASDAVDALKTRLTGKDVPGLAKLLGLNAEAAEKSDDFGERLEELANAATERFATVDTDADHKEIDLGSEIWPFPFPLEKTAQGWQFNTAAGLQEVIDRRIGENENQAIETVHLYVLAQALYASEDHDNDGVLEFARKLISTPGKHDGLYWRDEEDGEISPAGNFADPARVEGAQASDHGYFGYRYRILKSQGANIAGGAYDFVINGNMIAGHALIARPAIYGQTGIMTFVVSHHGIVYEKDLGPNTAEIADKIKSFNPDKTWSVVQDD